MKKQPSETLPIAQLSQIAKISGQIAALLPPHAFGPLKQEKPSPAPLPEPESIEAVVVPHMYRRDQRLSAPDLVFTEEPLISVVMTTYNSSRFVERAVRSILDQSWQRLELLVVDDCSTDDTRTLVARLVESDPRVQLLCFGVNRGTYWSKNFGITKARGDVITFMDSDDYALPKRLEMQFALLNQPGVAATTCSSVRVDEHGALVMNRGAESRLAPISMMMKRAVFGEIGFFDSVRTSADDEMLQRIRLVYGASAQRNVKNPLIEQLVREGSLTTDVENGVNLHSLSTDPKDFLSKPRLLYSAGYRRWHQLLTQAGCAPYVPFPVVNRPFPVFGKLAIDNRRYTGQAISACMATFPARREQLAQTVATVIDQVDRLFIYLNGYEACPEFLRHPKITAVLGGQNGDIRDNGKFYFMRDVPEGYCFTMDDDIRYPPNYVQHLIRKMELYDRQAVVGVHGVIFPKAISSFFRNRTVHWFRRALKRDRVVNLLGTGTLGFHTSLIRPRYEWFEMRGMADVFFAIHAKKLGVTLIAVEREENWMTDAETGEEPGVQLYREFRDNAALQTILVKACQPWREQGSPGLLAELWRRSERYGAAFRDTVFPLPAVPRRVKAPGEPEADRLPTGI